MTPFRGIIKFTKESVLIPAGSWKDVNKMLGPIELVLSKSASNVSLMILIWKIFGRYLSQERLPPQKSCFLVFCKACADWSVCQISNLWDQLFTFLQINGQILDLLDPQNIFCKVFAVLHHLKDDWAIFAGNWSHNNNLLLTTLICYNTMALPIVQCPVQILRRWRPLTQTTASKWKLRDERMVNGLPLAQQEENGDIGSRFVLFFENASIMAETNFTFGQQNLFIYSYYNGPILPWINHSRSQSKLY